MTGGLLNYGREYMPGQDARSGMEQLRGLLSGGAPFARVARDAATGLLGGGNAGMWEAAAAERQALADRAPGMTLAQLAPPTMSMPANEAIGGLLSGTFMAPIKAYHGSPHVFDRFSMDKIGTGEGAQAYGHGMYFADNPEVAKSYQETLTQRDSMTNSAWNAPTTSADLADSAKAAESVLRKFWGEWQPEDMIKEVRKSATPANLSAARTWLARQEQALASFPEDMRADFPNKWAELQKSARSAARQVQEIEEQIAALPALEQYGVDAFKRSPGALYTTTLDVEPEDLLDWDKPLSEQSAKVREAVAKINPDLVAVPEWRDGALIMPHNGHIAGEIMPRYGRYEAYDGNGRLISAFDTEAEAKSAVMRKVESGEQNAALRGSDAIKFLSSSGDPATASEALRAAGIPGIRYLDGGSRGAGQGTSNYVIFDDKLVRIDERNGQPLGLLESAR